MEIQWKHVFLAFVILIGLIYLRPAVDTIAEIIAGVIGTFRAALPPSESYSHGGSPTYSLARLCVLLIFVVGILKLIKNWNRR